VSRAASAVVGFALLALAAGTLGGCAAGGRAHARPAAAVPPPAPTAAGGTAPPASTEAPPAAGDDLPKRGGAITAPWDTAGTASGKASRRVHVYPSGLSPLGKRLVDSLPDPGGVAREDTPTAPAPAAPAPARTDSTPSIGESGCWEVQLLVSADHGRAAEVAKKVERDLDVAAWVKQSGGLYRVRAGGCLSPGGAGALANQLKEAGYPEAFRVMRDAP